MADLFVGSDPAHGYLAIVLCMSALSLLIAALMGRYVIAQGSGTPQMQHISNPIVSTNSVLEDGKPVYVAADREAVAKRWEREMEYYRSPELKFADESQRQGLLKIGEETAAILRAPQEPWRR